MMRRLASLALLLVACSAQPSGTIPTPSPWSCRLAVIQGSPGQGSGPQTPGFLTLPGLSFTPATDAGNGMYYDKPLKRWVPWGPPALSSDGASYAYVDGVQNSSRVHVVDVATGRDAVLTEGGPWKLVGLTSDAVYLMHIEFLPHSQAYGVIAAGRGLWKLPLTGGVAQELTKDTRYWTLGPKAAWGGASTVDVAGGPNDIVRFDLNTKQSAVWFAQGKRSLVLAIDASGVPLIMSEADSNEIWFVPSPNGGVKVWSSPANDLGPYAPVAVDGSVIWFSGRRMTREWGAYRYSAAKGVELTASLKDYPVSVAGPCA